MPCAHSTQQFTPVQYYLSAWLLMDALSLLTSRFP
jgi:hypothetical protein